MEISIKAIKELEKKTRKQLDTITENNALIFTSFKELDPVSFKNLYDQMEMKPYILSGCPGTISNTFKEFSMIVTDLMTTLAMINEKSKYSVDNLSDCLNTDDQNCSSDIEDINCKAHQMQCLKDAVQIKRNEPNKKLTKYLKKINEIIAKDKQVKGKITTHLLHKVEKLRKAGFDGYSQKVAVSGASVCLDEINEKIKKIKIAMKNRCSTIRDIIINQREFYSEFASVLDETADAINRIHNQINYNSDFPSYVESKRLIRYDIIPDEFVPIDLNHPVFQEVQAIWTVPSLQIYPLALARVMETFVTTYSQEISVSKGKLVYLMEDLSYPWAFVQNPYTRATGYAPSYLFEIIGKGLGAILVDVGSRDEMLQKGEYVAILENSDESNYLVLALNEVIMSVPKESVGLISELTDILV
ncbi:hypothetical protein TRFO_16004 [Tritrichomonas foetus]|uniref:SH3 domain-containing protein n=1 Tax=Tritrichomonas foetus TaxID=1144522 RepID=A0A1J4KVR0_9EUKA|nr:hypothetical protein TRFO_16004 [Tritrichomonas foetus]|eukprot:OHT13782.1 hypothetical protein TRFO_16004 [Tritrichomonas foetus]